MKFVFNKKQYTTDHCFICGEKNVAGLQMRFYETPDRQCVGIFTGRPEHCSYPGRMHGGVISAILDETVGRAAELENPGTFGVTTTLTVTFRRPVPLGVELCCVGWLTQNKPRMFEGVGKILLPDGKVADIKAVKYTNLCDISLHVDARTGTFIAVSALDNMVKGAAGQAVQNMNIVFGLPEETGLCLVPPAF